MKIAILTQPIKHNYGGIIQAYALEHILESFGHEVTILNIVDNRLKRYSFKERVGSIIYRAYLHYFKGQTDIKVVKNYKLSLKQEEVVYKKTLEFINSNMNLSSKILSHSNLSDYSKLFDAFVVGSDQVWRYRYSPYLPHYYLDFLGNSDKLRIAYAASFGLDSIDEYPNLIKEECRELIKKFNGISVREYSGISICEKEFGISPEWVLDPTMLLSSEDYVSLINKNYNQKLPTNSSGNCFIYFLNEEDAKKKLALNICNSISYEMFDSKSRISVADVTKNNITDAIKPALEEWLACIYYSDLIITDSFHGCVFSIIFKKDFWVLDNETRGTTRIDSLLNLFELSDRRICNQDMVNRNRIKTHIDYTKVYEIMEVEKEKSINFLKQFFGEKE